MSSTSSSFLVEKQSKNPLRRGRYSRIIRLRRGTIATIDPSTYEKTNQWDLHEVAKVIADLNYCSPSSSFCCLCESGKMARSRLIFPCLTVLRPGDS